MSKIRKEKPSKGMKGKHHSEETKQKISDGVKKHIKEKNNEI